MSLPDTLTHQHPSMTHQGREGIFKNSENPIKQLSHFTQEPAPCQGSGEDPKKQWQSPKFFFSKGKPKPLIKVSKDVGK